jgi:hypothetical protein
VLVMYLCVRGTEGGHVLCVRGIDVGHVFVCEWYRCMTCICV